MSIAARIAPNLPLLRRFARALTGSQELGDAGVKLTLEAIANGEVSLSDHEPPRAALYQAFLQVTQKHNDGLAQRKRENLEVADARLLALSPLSRQVFLLMFVENFSVEETAKILNISPDEVRQNVDQAGREISEQVASDVLIVEDELLIALDLKELVTSLGHRPIAVARTRKEAVNASAAHKPGLVLADIQLADESSGIDAVNDILRRYEVPVIFITAYPERLLTGERPEPTYLLTKPFNHNMVKAVISQALFFRTNAHAGANPA